MVVIRRRHKALTLVILAVYLMALFYFLFFSERMGRTGEVQFEVNLIPFQEIRRFWALLQYPQWRVAAFLNLAGNIIIFMPFGGLVALLIHPKERWYLSTLLALELSLCVELIQLAARIGCFDVDDLILNTVGGLLGYWVYKLWKRFYPGKRVDAEERTICSDDGQST